MSNNLERVRNIRSEIYCSCLLGLRRNKSFQEVVKAINIRYKPVVKLRVPKLNIMIGNSYDYRIFSTNNGYIVLNKRAGNSNRFRSLSLIGHGLQMPPVISCYDILNLDGKWPILG